MRFKMEDIHMINGTLKQGNRMMKANIENSPDPSHQQFNHPPLFFKTIPVCTLSGQH